jgi:ankyrin repeat protein
MKTTITAILLASAFLCGCGEDKEAPAAPQQSEAAAPPATPAPDPALDEALAMKVMFGTSGEVEALLKQGARPGATDRYGLPVLFMAAKAGNTAAAELLIKAGADVNASVGTSYNQDGVGYSGTSDGTVLAYAAASGKVEMLELLRAAGADINGAAPGGTTPLMMAAENGRAESVEWLLNNGSFAGREEALAISRRFINPNDSYKKLQKLLAGEPL